MRLFLTLFVLLISSTILRAQEVYDIIYLIDGSFYKGSITEYIPKDHATLKLLDGRIITVKAIDIRDMETVERKHFEKNIAIKSKGYFHNSLIGPQFGKSQYGDVQPTFAYNMVNGYKINGHHSGIGLGLEKHAGNWYVPIYADYSYHFLKQNFRPLVGVNGGFMVPLETTKTDGPFYRYNYQKGAFVGGRIGFVAYGGEHFAFLLNLTYRYIHLDDASYSYGVFPFAESYTYTGAADLHRIGVMIGFLIN